MCNGICNHENSRGECCYKGNSIPDDAPCNPNYKEPMERCPNCDSAFPDWNSENEECNYCQYPNHEIIDDTEELFNKEN